MDGGAFRPAGRQGWVPGTPAIASARMPVRRGHGRRRFDGGGRLAIIGFLTLAAAASLGAAVIGLAGLKHATSQDQPRQGLALPPQEQAASASEIAAMRAAEAALLRDLAALSDRVELARIDLLRIEAARAQALETPIAVPPEPEPVAMIQAEAEAQAISSAPREPLAPLDDAPQVAELPIVPTALPALPEPQAVLDPAPIAVALPTPPDPDAPLPVRVQVLQVPTAPAPSRAAPQPVTAWTAPRFAAAAAPLPRVFLHHAGQPEVAATLARGVHGEAFAVAEIRAVRATPNDPAVRYFHAADRPAALALARRLGEASGTTWRVRDFTFFRPPADPGTLEVWVPPR